MNKKSLSLFLFSEVMEKIEIMKANNRKKLWKIV